MRKKSSRVVIAEVVMVSSWIGIDAGGSANAHPYGRAERAVVGSPAGNAGVRWVGDLVRYNLARREPGRRARLEHRWVGGALRPLWNELPLLADQVLGPAALG